MNSNMHEEEYAYYIHSSKNFDCDTDSNDDKSDFDEFYYDNKPPPFSIKDGYDVVKIVAFSNTLSKSKISKSLYKVKNDLKNGKKGKGKKTCFKSERPTSKSEKQIFTTNTQGTTVEPDKQIQILKFLRDIEDKCLKNKKDQKLKTCGELDTLQEVSSTKKKRKRKKNDLQKTKPKPIKEFNLLAVEWPALAKVHSKKSPLDSVIKPKTAVSNNKSCLFKTVLTEQRKVGSFGFSQVSKSKPQEKSKTKFEVPQKMGPNIIKPGSSGLSSVTCVSQKRKGVLNKVKQLCTNSKIPSTTSNNNASNSLHQIRTKICDKLNLKKSTNVKVTCNTIKSPKNKRKDKESTKSTQVQCFDHNLQDKKVTKSKASGDENFKKIPTNTTNSLSLSTKESKNLEKQMNSTNSERKLNKIQANTGCVSVIKKENIKKENLNGDLTEPKKRRRKKKIKQATTCNLGSAHSNLTMGHLKSDTSNMNSDCPEIPTSLKKDKNISNENQIKNVNVCALSKQNTKVLTKPETARTEKGDRLIIRYEPKNNSGSTSKLTNPPTDYQEISFLQFLNLHLNQSGSFLETKDPNVVLKEEHFQNNPINVLSSPAPAPLPEEKVKKTKHKKKRIRKKLAESSAVLKLQPNETAQALAAETYVIPEQLESVCNSISSPTFAHTSFTEDIAKLKPKRKSRRNKNKQASVVESDAPEEETESVFNGMSSPTVMHTTFTEDIAKLQSAKKSRRKNNKSQSQYFQFVDHILNMTSDDEDDWHYMQTPNSLLSRIDSKLNPSVFGINDFILRDSVSMFSDLHVSTDAFLPFYTGRKIDKLK